VGALHVEPSREHMAIARQMRSWCRVNPWIGTVETMERCRRLRQVVAVADREMRTNLLLTFDVGYHASGWWRNADYNACWHLSLSWPSPGRPAPAYEEMPRAELDYWARVFFGDFARWLWHEPGGAKQPGRSLPERLPYKHIEHLRLFVDEPTMQPIFPRGEVYDLTRWVDGLTPEKVDR
jgi:hypothetical protein